MNINIHEKMSESKFRLASQKSNDINFSLQKMHNLLPKGEKCDT